MSTIEIHLVILLPTILYAMQGCLYAHMAILSKHTGHREFLISYALCAVVDLALAVCHYLAL